MSMPRPLASLSSTLLARKGAARPAMRPQPYAPVDPAAAVDDLGWNDMGRAPAPEPVPEPEPEETALEPSVRLIPPVLVTREALAEAIEAPAAVRPVSIATATRLRRETAHAGKAALTLRLEADRHLRLRLASAISNRSAQQLLVQALDALIKAMPEVDTLVAQLPPAPIPTTKRTKTRSR